MAIYSDTKIKEIINKKDIVINPYKDENLTGIGYDLRVGIIQPLSKISDFNEDDDYYYIPPYSYCIVISKEFVWLSHKLAATLHARGTLAAKGLYTNSTNIDPNFNGQLIMSVFNVSEKPIKIGKNEHYITMIVQDVVKSTKTLIDDNSKNSSRVTSHFNEIYGDEIVAQTSQLHEYLHNENTKNGGKFQDLITQARNKNPLKNFSWDKVKVKFFTLSVLSYIIMGILLLLIVLLVVNRHTQLISEKNLDLIVKISVLVGVLFGIIKSSKK